jgi:hypothetical protein
MGDLRDSFWLVAETGESRLTALTALIALSAVSVLMRSTEVSMVGGFGLRRNLEILSMVTTAGLNGRCGMRGGGMRPCCAGSVEETKVEGGRIGTR